MFRARLTLPPELGFMLLLVVFYLGVSSLVSAYARMFYIIVPPLIVWIAYVSEKCCNLRIVPEIHANS
jgi:hypothetical protein